MLCTEPVDVLSVPTRQTASAFDLLEAFLVRNRQRRSVGFLGYDLRDAVEPIARTITDDLPVPVLWFAAFDRIERVDDVVFEALEALRATNARWHMTRASYEQKVATIVEHICAGDLFQANLTQPFTARFEGDPRTLFARLCEISPAPFAAYLGLDRQTSILSASPEEFLQVDGPALRTRPIKGTRPRGRDSATDQALLSELLHSDKDRAELAMIVDLMRNDFGKVAKPGSVEVAAFPEHASYAQVHHLFATVTAERRDDISLVDLLRAVFPGGSITGAPKLRSMELIEELEVVRRGVYTGAIGWIGPGPQMHLNVAIRTLTRSGALIRGNVGGGITAQSVPSAEYEETWHKALGLLRALGLRPDTLAMPAVD